jgi:hypothetical protein
MREGPATGGSQTQLDLLPGVIPAALREVIPFPNDIRVVGSHISQRGTTVVFDSALSKERILSFYEDRLLPSGWTKPEPFDFFQRGGFSHSMADVAWLQMQYFCRGSKEPYIVVHALDQPDKPTEVRLSYVTDQRGSPCDSKQRNRMSMFVEEDPIIPRLTPPQKSLQTPKGGQVSSQDYFVESIAYLKSKSGLEALHGHYAAQLQAGGWQQSDSGGDHARAWSTFTFGDKDGQNWWGLLLISAFPTRWGEYLLYVLARHEEAEADFDNYMSRLGGMWLGYS